ncbi:MAG: TIGR03750 family conjugal transfer protein [Legionella sp.]|nr:TIGR03750 family conjugal transfer protein [Legionella sp.]
MNQPSSRHLSHDYEAYKGLSLRDLFWIVFITTPSITLLFTIIGLFTGYPVASGCVGFIVGFIVSITFCPKRAASIKAGKPHGYLRKKIILLMARWGLRPSPYIHHIGAWQKSKILR